MILYTSTAFDDDSIANGDPTTGNDGYGCSILVNNGGGYENSNSLTCTSTARIVGDQLTGGAIEGGTGPYSQVLDMELDFGIQLILILQVGLEQLILQMEKKQIGQVIMMDQEE